MRVIHGDCLEVMPQLAAEGLQADACVTDPPYHLASIVKRFGKDGAAPAQFGSDGRFARASRGFMGKQWDGGDIAARPETWALVLDLLKPGAHLIAFGGTRTYHRMACAIEDAGFEIRDQIGWLYGSGFPKSHDIGKSIDKRGGVNIAWFGPWLRQERERRGISQKSLSRHFPSKSGGQTGCVANWELGLNLPTASQFNTLCSVMDLPFAQIEEAERAIVGRNARPRGWFTAQDGHDITAPATDAARQWAGWGTALKPAWEPIVLARKPLRGTVAANVQEHGTGALNIDGCRIEGAVPATVQGQSANAGTIYGADQRTLREFQPHALGRWPANVIHDGSDEVLAAFPESDSVGHVPAVRGASGYSGGWAGHETGQDKRLAGGSAARFFYSAKADSDDRLGSKHPTVKPVDLIAYLCRLVTPPGGLVLDPFAGSGTTGMACMREGFRAILIEREAEYVADIHRRLAHVKGDDTPLFAAGAA